MSHASTLDAACIQHCLLGNAIDGMSVGMIVTNAAGRVAWMNRSAQRILGIDKLESTGLVPADLTWNGGAWMPVLEPVTDLVPNWKVLGLYPNLLW